MNLADTSTTTYLVRHGQTALNAAGLLRGRLDPPLDPVGQRQAAALGDLFHDVKLLVVITSPLRRATQTAQPIAVASGAPLVVDVNLLDRDYGPWAGTASTDVERRFGSVDDAPGVEPLEQFEHRVVCAVAELAHR